MSFLFERSLEGLTKCWQQTCCCSKQRKHDPRDCLLHGLTAPKLKDLQSHTQYVNGSWGRSKKESVTVSSIVPFQDWLAIGPLVFATRKEGALLSRDLPGAW